MNCTLQTMEESNLRDALQIFIAKKLPALIQTTARTFTKNNTPNNDTNLQLFFLLAVYGRTIQCSLFFFFFYMSRVHLYNCTLSMEKGLETHHSDLNRKPSGTQPGAPHVASRASCCEDNLGVIIYDH